MFRPTPLAILCSLVLQALPVSAEAAPGSPPGARSPEPGSASASNLRLVDQLVAVVEKQPIMRSEIEFEARVALISKGGIAAIDAELSDDVLASTTDYVIGQKVAFLEAERLQVFTVDDAEVFEVRHALVQRFPNELAYRQFLEKHETSEEQLLAILRRDLRVARFIDSKVKLMARVSEAELRRFYDTHAEDFAGQPYTRVREGIRAMLLRERYQDLARSQLDQLRARSDIRLVAGFARSRIKPRPPPTDGFQSVGPFDVDDDSEELSP